MSLQDMVNRYKEVGVEEGVKIGPHNSKLPINVWFDRDAVSKHEDSPRFKIQNKKGDANQRSFIPYLLKTFDKAAGKLNVPDRVSPKKFDDTLDFIIDNKDVIDKYYGYDREQGRTSRENRMDQESFVTEIIKRADKYF